MTASNVIRLKPVVPCPVCKKPSSQVHHPFCSPRCQDIDLNRWLSGVYVIPGQAIEEDDGPHTQSDEDDS